ncbi:MAG: glycosyltransferase family 4 protein, partial [Acidimicrobiales bacterium]
GYFTAPAPRDELRVRFDLEGFVVAYTGAHGIANGLDLVLDAANTIRSEPCDIKLLLVGDGPLKASLQRRAGAEGLTNVVFRPAIPKSEMPALLGAVDAGLHCLADLPMFRYGVSPNKLFDYLAAGLPVLTNTQGEVADIVVACGAGVAVAPHDIAGGIRQLWQADPEQRAAWGRAGRDCVRLNYDRNKLADQLEALLDEMAPPPGRGSAPT